MYLKLTSSFIFLSCLATVLAEGARPYPITIPLTSRKVPRGSLASRQLSNTLPLKDYFNGTDLQWYGDFYMGTPPQKFTVVYDTGSYEALIPTTNCTTCSRQKKFDPTKSQTFIDVGRDSTVDFSSGTGVDPVINDEDSNSNYQMHLRQIRETVQIGGYALNNFSMSLITSQTPTFDPDPFDGIVGLEGSGQVVKSLVAAGMPPLFSFYLTPDSVGNAELTFGGIDDTKHVGEIQYVPINKNTGGDWLPSASSIFVNGKTTPDLNTTQIMPFDSGLSNFILPTELADAIYALISPEIKPNPDQPGTYGVPCALVKDIKAEVTLNFLTEDNKTLPLTIPSSELSVGPFRNNESLCQTFINGDIFTSIGGSLLKHYYSVWDVGNLRMGFAPAVGV